MYSTFTLLFYRYPHEDLVFKYAKWALDKNEGLAATVSKYINAYSVCVTVIQIKGLRSLNILRVIYCYSECKKNM